MSEVIESGEVFAPSVEESPSIPLDETFEIELGGRFFKVDATKGVHGADPLHARSKADAYECLDLYLALSLRFNAATSARKAADKLGYSVEIADEMNWKRAMDWLRPVMYASGRWTVDVLGVSYHLHQWVQRMPSLRDAVKDRGVS
jgi:hypothetical protein